MGSWRDNEVLVSAVEDFGKIDVPKILCGEFIPVKNPGDSKRRVFRQWRIDALHDIVADYFDVPACEIPGPVRANRYSLPRQVCWYILQSSDTIAISPRQIGDAYTRERTTILHGIERVTELFLDDPELKRTVSDIRQEWEALGV